MAKLATFFLVFAASFCLMVLELVAGRLIAPFVGTSIYTWTSIIGIFLLGITLGNWTGGKIADRRPQKKYYGVFFTAAALTSVFILLVIPIWHNVAKSAAWIPGIIALYAGLTFFPAAFFLSCITPLAIKLNLRELEKTGRTVGNIYGISAAGSILGTFLTGFWFIPSFGTRKIIWLIFAVLAAIGLYYLFRYSSKKILTIIAIVIAMSAGTISFNQKGQCQWESQYYCIHLEELDVRGTDAKGYSLVLDHLEHNHVYPIKVDPFGDGYSRVIASLMSYSFQPQDEFSVLVVGGGGYVIPRYLIAAYPKARVTVFELDPLVTDVALEYFGIRPDPRLQIFHADARLSSNRLRPEEKFDLVVGDAFTDFSVPYHLTTREFVQKIRDHLTPSGLYVINLVDSIDQGRFVSSNLLTIGSVFTHTYLMPLFAEWYKRIGRNTFLVVGTNLALDPKKWDEARPLFDPLWDLSTKEAQASLKAAFPLQDGALREYIKKARGIVLTDDFAPVDNMLGVLYQKQF